LKIYLEIICNKNVYFTKII